MSNKTIGQLRAHDQLLTPDVESTISAGFNVYQSNFTVLSGNFLQTNSGTAKNYSARNAFIQAEEAFNSKGVSYGVAYTGTKGFCILNVNPTLSTLTLSGDLASLVLSATYSISLEDTAKSMCTRVVSVNGNSVTISPWIDDITKLSSKTEEEMIGLFLSDDNAFYAPKYPECGNVAIENFYGNHAEGGSVRAIGKYTHAEGRDTTADVRYSHAEGSHNIAGGMASHAEGFYTEALGRYSHAAGQNAKANDPVSYAWSCGTNYGSHGYGTYNVCPKGGIDGFYVGENTLRQHISGMTSLLAGKNLDITSLEQIQLALSAVIIALGGNATITPEQPEEATE